MTATRRKVLLALTAACAAGALSGTVWAVKNRSQVLHRLRVADTTQRMRSALQDAADAHVDALEGLARTLEAGLPRNGEEYRDLAVRASVQAPAFSSVNFVDHRFIEKFLFPYGPNRALEGLDLKTRADALPAARQAIASRRPASTDLVPLAQGGAGFLGYAPVFRENRWEGLVEGSLDKDAFAERYVLPATPKGHAVALLSETSDLPFFATDRSAAPGGAEPFDLYDFYFTMRFGDRRWWVVLHPRTPPSPLLPLVGLMLLELGAGAFATYRLLKPNKAA